ncbi:MAG: IS4 family transposase [Alphaproteobacteria bacterium]|nr:IS4 family transposase [Alphaproteobacteria bacterium]
MRKMNTLDQAINNHFDWHPLRNNFFKERVISAIRTGHIHYKKLVEYVSGDAKECSKNRQMQRFMQKQDIDYTQAGKIVIELLGLKDSFILAMDRTNWKFGNKEINYLVISVVYESTSIPLIWKELDKKGNSNTEERKGIVLDLLKIIDVNKIKILTGDREFEGEELFKFLQENNIKYLVRLKSSHLLRHFNGEKMQAGKIFEYLSKNEIESRKGKVLGVSSVIAVKKLKSGLLIACTNNLNLKEKEMLKSYKERWKIETLFKNTKTKYFNIEETHLKETKKLEKLLLIITVACAISVLNGKIRNCLEKIKTKNHDRKLYSLLTYGIDFIKNNMSLERITRFKYVSYLLSFVIDLIG